MTEERRKQAREFRRIGDASTVGLAFPIAIAIGYFWGKALDGYLGTGPWLKYVFTAFGVAAGFLNAIRVGLRVGREEDEADRQRRER